MGGVISGRSGADKTPLADDLGAGTGVDIIGDWIIWNGGTGDMWVWGDLGGGKAQLQAAIDITAPVTLCETCVTDVTPTSSAVVKFTVNQGTKVRVIITDTTAPSSGINVVIN